jgi:predicted MFS family arabinose efflux permease
MMIRTTSALGGMLLAGMLSIIGNSNAIVQPLLVGMMVDRYGLSGSAAGMISAAEMAAFGGGAFAAAWLLGRSDRRLLTAGALLLAIMGNAMAALAPSVPILAAARLVAGAGTGAALAIGGAIVAGSTSPDRIYSIITVGVLVYAGSFLTFVPPFMASVGAAPFLAMGLLALVTLPMAVIAPPAPAAKDDRGEAALPPLRPGALIPLLAAALLLYAGHGAVWTYEERMGVAIGMTVPEVGAALGLASLAGIIGAAAAAILGLRWGRTWPQVIALTVSAAAALIIVTVRDADGYFLGASLIAIVWFFGLPYLNGLAASLDPQGRIAAMLAAMLNLGMAAGPFIAALIVADNGYFYIGLLACCFYLACLALILPQSIATDRQLAAGRRPVQPVAVSAPVSP